MLPGEALELDGDKLRCVNGTVVKEGTLLQN
jgi:hypothetical protein